MKAISNSRTLPASPSNRQKERHDEIAAKLAELSTEELFILLRKEIRTWQANARRSAHAESARLWFEPMSAEYPFVPMLPQAPSERLLEPRQLDILRRALIDAAHNGNLRQIWLEVGDLLFAVRCEPGCFGGALTVWRFICGSSSKVEEEPEGK